MKRFFNIIKKILLVCVCLILLIIISILFVYSFNTNYDKTVYSIQGNMVRFYKNYAIKDINKKSVKVYNATNGKFLKENKICAPYEYLKPYSCNNKDYIMLHVSSSLPNELQVVNKFAYMDLLSGHIKEFTIPTKEKLPLTSFTFYTPDNKIFFLGAWANQKESNLYVFDSTNNKLVKLISGNEEISDYKEKYNVKVDLSNMGERYYINKLNNNNIIVFNNKIGRIKIFNSSLSLIKEMDLHTSSIFPSLSGDKKYLIVPTYFNSPIFKPVKVQTIDTEEKSIIKKTINSLVKYAYAINLERSFSCCTGLRDKSYKFFSNYSNEMIFVNMDTLKIDKNLYFPQRNTFFVIYSDNTLLMDSKEFCYPNVLIYDYKKNKLQKFTIPCGVKALYYGEKVLINNKLYYITIGNEKYVSYIKTKKIDDK